MTATWDSNGFARLIENVDCRGEDPPQVLELQRNNIFFSGLEPREIKERKFNLTIYDGSDDMSFHGMTARQICDVAESMIKLVGGSFRVDPPADPEINF